MKVLGLTIFLAKILELLSSETAIWIGRFSFQQHSKLNSWLSVVILFQNSLSAWSARKVLWTRKWLDWIIIWNSIYISVHVSLQYIICPFFGQIKAFFVKNNVSFFSQTFTKLMLLTQRLWAWIKRLALLGHWQCSSLTMTLQCNFAHEGDVKLL